MSINLDNAKNFGSYLEKKSHKTFGGYQKRYFRIVEEGNYLAYYDKEKDNINKYKGRIPVDSIKGLQKKEDKKFRIMLKNDERIYHLKAKNKELRDNWVTALELILALKESKQPEKEHSVNLEKKEVKEERVEDEKDSDKEQIEERAPSIIPPKNTSTALSKKQEKKK